VKDKQQEISQAFVSAIRVALAGTLVAGLAASQSVMAFDCTTNPYITFPPVTYTSLRDGLDINDSGCVVFADGNGVYVATASSGKVPCGYTGLILKRGGLTGTGSNYVLIAPRELQRINESGCVAFLADISPLNLNCRPAPLSCGELDPPCMALIAIVPGVVRGRGTGPADCVRRLLFKTTNSGNPTEIFDLDMLETKAPIPSQVPPVLDYRAIAALGDGDGHTDRIAFLGPGALQETQYTDALVGGSAPDGTTYQSGAQFSSVTEGDVAPEAFRARTSSLATRAVVSELHASMTSCATIPGGNAVNSRIDQGCVECFGTADTSVVHYVDKNAGSCSGAGGTTVLVESWMTSATPLAVDTRVQAKLGKYITLDCGELMSFGDGIHPVRVSASQTPSLPPRCGRCTGSSYSVATGVAVFKGTWRPSGGSTIKKAIFVVPSPGRVHVLVQEGDPLPFPQQDKTFVDFGDPRVNLDGTVVFWAHSNMDGCNVGGSGSTLCGGVFVYALGPFLAGLDPYWDLDADGSVGVTDQLILEGMLWGTDGPCGDFNHDGDVGTPDLLDLFAHWGTCP
jgi:hypothetical protein